LTFNSSTSAKNSARCDAVQHGATARSFQLLSFICREYQVINDYSDTSNESRSTGVTNPCGALHPRVSGGHTMSRARSQMSLRSMNSRGRGWLAKCVKSYETRAR